MHIFLSLQAPKLKEPAHFVVPSSQRDVRRISANANLLTPSPLEFAVDQPHHVWYTQLHHTIG